MVRVAERTMWRIMVQIGCLCPLPKQDAFLELVRGSRALDVPGGLAPATPQSLALETHWQSQCSP
jgi:hypothetical protein